MASPGSVGKDGRILAPAGEAGAGRHSSQQRAGENKSLFAALIYYLEGNRDRKNNIPERLSPCNLLSPQCPSLPVGTWGCHSQHMGAHVELCPHSLPTAGREKQQEKCLRMARGLRDTRGIVLIKW